MWKMFVDGKEARFQPLVSEQMRDYFRRIEEAGLPHETFPIYRRDANGKRMPARVYVFTPDVVADEPVTVGA